METPARQRKPPTSNGKVSILDTKTGKTYPSKNNAYQSLLKAGELEDLVKQGVFGSDPLRTASVAIICSELTLVDLLK